ncbi:MAG: hypothetical protein GKS01_09735 [Alphaproteobacteria bacterium]|nr:hypothetical protein [Alphaproteobacteria bacterium]
MTYTLDQMVQDCREALSTDRGAVGRNAVRQIVEKACMDEAFVTEHLGPDNDVPRQVPYEDEDYNFCILVHVAAAETGLPHGHGPTWAIYGIAAGITEMTDWHCIEEPDGRTPGKVVKVKSYELPTGTAHLYNEGDLHSSRREHEVRMVRVEGMNLYGVRRPRYEAAA